MPHILTVTYFGIPRRIPRILNGTYLVCQQEIPHIFKRYLFGMPKRMPHILTLLIWYAQKNASYFNVYLFVCREECHIF